MPGMLRPDFLKGYMHMNGAAGTVFDAGGIMPNTIVKNGVGDYTITLSSGLDINENHLVVTVLGGIPLTVAVTQISDTVIQILLETNAGAPGDANLKLTLLKLLTE